jgi:DNA polymerase elongation subunit (family B)
MDPSEVVTLEKLNKKTYKLVEGTTTVGNLLHIIEENNLIISANGAIFDPSKKSIVAEILTDWFNLRKEYKSLMKKSYKEGDKEKGELYNQKQHAIKILLNSVYGTFAINSWRFTDGHKICSSAITTTGQRFIMETIKYANEMIKEDYFS